MISNFKDEINELEISEFEDDYIIKKGSIPVIFTAPHTIKHYKDGNLFKLNEPYTKAIALYLNKYCDANCLVKIKDTGIDSNKDNHDDFKKDLIDYIKNNNIKLVIDIHGASNEHGFDVEFGTLDNKSASSNTITKLTESFKSNDINNIAYNDPFKGGAITQYVSSLTDAEVIQVEISALFRDYQNIDKLEKICKSFETFIESYLKK